MLHLWNHLKINVTMKQILLLIAMLVLAVVPMWAEEEEHYWVDDILYTINDDSTSVTVKTCSDGMTSLVIPSSVNIDGVNYRVTDIGEGAFDDDWYLRYVDTGDGVERIGANAFNNITHLDSVTIGRSVSSIGYNAFDYSSLRKVLIKDLAAWCNIDFANYRANPIYQNAHLVLNGEVITDLIIPETVTEIKNNAFAGGTFTSVTFPKGLTRIGAYAFNYCFHLNTPLVLPNSLTKIEDWAFHYCDAIPEVYFGDSIASIGEYAFDYCTSLTAVHITNLEGWCNGDFRDNPLQRAHQLYLGDEKITDLIIPEGTKVIKNNAFGSCLSIQSVTIPTSLQEIGRYTFEGCNNINHLTWNARNCHPSSGYNAWLMPSANINTVTIGDQVEVIPRELLAGAKIKSLVLPNSVKEIGIDAFKNCSQLSDLTLSDSLQVIGNTAFANCSALTEVIIPDAVISIGQKAFRYCSKLNSLTIGKGVKTINGYAIEGCSSLRHITFNAIDLTDLFYYYPSALEELTIGEEVQSIPEGLAYGCGKLTSVTIPNSVRSIGYMAFYRCTGLKKVHFGNSVSLIDSYAFAQCESLESVTLPKSVTTLKDNAFKGCISLKTAILPSALTQISGDVFSDCSSLVEVNIPPRVRSIGIRAFYKCSNLRYIALPDSLTQIGQSAFQYCTAIEDIYSMINDPSQCNVFGLWRFEEVDKEKCILHVPIGTTAAYRAQMGWKDFIHIVEEDYPHLLDDPNDVDGDGEITVNDANSVVVIIINGGGKGHTRIPNPDGNGWSNLADVNNDGEVNIADFNTVIDKILSHQ